MPTLRLPSGLVREICQQPIDRGSARPVAPPDPLACISDESSFAVMVVPGIAESGDQRLLDPLIEAIRGYGTLKPSIVEVITGPTPWPLEMDLRADAGALRPAIGEEHRGHRGSRLVFVAFSLGGTALLYALSTLLENPHDLTVRPLVVTLASPLVASDRYARAFQSWRHSATDSLSIALERVTSELGWESAVMPRVRQALNSCDVHALISCGDAMVDHSAAWLGHDRSEEIDVGAGSGFRAHFRFPQSGPVIRATVTTLLNHLCQSEIRRPSNRQLLPV